MNQAPSYRSLMNAVEAFNQECQKTLDKFNGVLSEVVTLGDGFLNAGTALRRSGNTETYFVSHDCTEDDVDNAIQELAAAKSDDERVEILVRNRILTTA